VGTVLLCYCAMVLWWYSATVLYSLTRSSLAATFPYLSLSPFSPSLPLPLPLPLPPPPPPAPRIAMKGHLLAVTALASLRVDGDNDTWILSGSEDKTLMVWSLVTGELVATLTVCSM
jgi:hypothetical protein